MLWDIATISAGYWTPSQTVLLITNASFSADRGPTVSLGNNTLVDVDPAIAQTRTIRRFAEDLTRKKHVNPPFPNDLFDAETLASTGERALYTLADVDEQARTCGSQIFSGYLSVIITEVNLSKLHLQNMLLCGECCGVPVYSNKAVALCKRP